MIQFTNTAAEPKLKVRTPMIMPGQQQLYNKWRPYYPIEITVGRINPNQFFLDTGVRAVSVVLTTGQRLMMFKTLDDKQKLIEWITP